MNKSTRNEHYIKVLLAIGDHSVAQALLSMLNWEDLGFQICSTVENGKDAWKLFLQQLPDLVITDPQLSMMDGLLLTQNIRKKMPDVHVVFLATEADFETARQAVALNVSAFFLYRELTAALLGQCLLSIREKILRRTNMVRLYRRSCLEAFLCAPENPGREEALSKELTDIPSVCWGIILVGEPQKILPFTPWNSGNAVGAHNYLRQLVCAPWVLEQLHREFHCQIIAIPCLGSSVLVLLCFEQSFARKSSQASIICQVAEVIWNACGDRGQHPTVLYQENCLTAVSQIYAVYLTLVQHFRYTLFGFSQQIVNILALGQLLPSQEGSIPLNQIKSFSGIEYDQIIKFLEREYDSLSRTKDIKYLEVFLQAVDHLLDNLLQHEMCSPADAETIRLKIGECVSIRELKELLEQFVYHTCCSGESAHSLRIRKVIRFIYQNYMLDISIQDAAAQVGLNPEYLNKVFKREVGVGFSRYLTGYRIKVAKDLLSRGEARIGEVAELVGYKNSQYFSVVFRQEVGISPTEFIRKQ